MIRYRFILHIVSSLVLIISSVGCSSYAYNDQVSGDSKKTELQPEHVIDIKEIPAPLEPINGQAYRYYVNGLLYEELRSYLSAAEQYRLALNIHPDSKELTYVYARALKAGGNPQRAIDVIDSIMTNETRMLYLKAACYMEINRIDEAKRIFSKLTVMDSTNVESFLYLATIYQRLGITDSLIWAYNKASYLQPQNYLLLNEIARIYQQTGQVDKAQETLNRSLSASSGLENLRGLISLGAILQQKGNLDSAIIMFTRGINLDPSNDLLHREIARLRFAQDSAELALPHVRAIAELKPDDLLAQQQLGVLLFSLMMTDEADSLFTALVDDGIVSAPNHMYLGRIALIKEDFTRAHDEFQILVQLEDSVYDNWEALAYSYRQLHNTKMEIETYINGLDHMNNEGSAVQMYFSLGAAYERNDNVDSAIASFEFILEHHPDHAPSLNFLGYTLADRGIKLKYARTLIERAVEMQPENPAYLDSYGWVLYQLKEYDNALHYLATAATLADDPVIFEHLGDAYNAVGEKGKAKNWWRKALEEEPDNRSVIEEKLAH